MPQGSKTPFITVKALDTYEGMTDFDYGSSFHLKQKRFQESGAAITYMPNNNLFTPNVKQRGWNQLSPEEMKAMVRDAKKKRNEFISWSLNNEEKLLNQMLEKNESTSAIQKFHQIQGADSYLWAGEKTPIKGSGGLGYLLPGSIHNTPRGIAQAKTVKGRLVPSYPNLFRAAIGGFTALTSSSNFNSHKMPEATQNFLITKVSVRPNGSVEMSSQEESLSKPSKGISEHLNKSKNQVGNSLSSTLSFRG